MYSSKENHIVNYYEKIYGVFDSQDFWYKFRYLCERDRQSVRLDSAKNIHDKSGTWFTVCHDKESIVNFGLLFIDFIQDKNSIGKLRITGFIFDNSKKIIQILSHSQENGDISIVNDDIFVEFEAVEDLHEDGVCIYNFNSTKTSSGDYRQQIFGNVMFSDLLSFHLYGVKISDEKYRLPDWNYNVGEEISKEMQCNIKSFIPSYLLDEYVKMRGARRDAFNIPDIFASPVKCFD